MRTATISLFLFLTAALIACATAKIYTLDTLPDERMIFSYGGGFTGEWNDYLLLSNGQLFHRRRVLNPVPFRAYDPIDPKVAKDLFVTFEAQKFGALGYDDPGNMSYTIKSINGSDTTAVTWGGTETKPTEELRTYWRRVMQTFDGKQPLAANR